MNAVLSIELEVLEPVRVGSADDLLALHPSQIRWISIRLTANEQENSEAAVFNAQTSDSRVAIRALVSLAQRSQPSGTRVMVWFQGRSESFTIASATNENQHG